MKLYKRLGQTAILFFLLLVFSCNTGKYYSVTAEFDKVDGLYEKAVVTVSGLHVGYVNKIQLADNKINVTICINKDHKISDRASFVIKNADAIGTKFIEIEDVAGAEKFLEDGDKIKGVYDDTPVSTGTGMTVDSLVLNVAKPILDSLGYDVTPKAKK